MCFIENRGLADSNNINMNGDNPILPIENIKENLDLVGASPMPEGMEQMLVAQPAREQILSTIIRENIALSESISKGVSIFDYRAASKGAEDYDNLSNEIITRLKE